MPFMPELFTRTNFFQGFFVCNERSHGNQFEYLSELEIYRLNSCSQIQSMAFPTFHEINNIRSKLDFLHLTRILGVHDFVHGVAQAAGAVLAAGAKVSLRPALPFPRLLLLLPDRIHTPRNTSAISL